MIDCGWKEYCLIDVGESAKAKERAETHERETVGKKTVRTLTYAVCYTLDLQQPGRKKKIEQEIRDQYDPPCGKT